MGYWGKTICTGIGAALFGPIGAGIGYAIGDAFDSDSDSPETSDEVKAYLHSHLELWHYSLQLVRREIELQLSCQKTKVEMHKNNLRKNNSQYAFG